MDSKDYMFKIGQTVTVRKDLNLKDLYFMRSGEGSGNSNNFATESMIKLAGKKVYIDKMWGPQYEIAEDGNQCCWTDDMFEERFEKNRIFHGLI